MFPPFDDPAMFLWEETWEEGKIAIHGATAAASPSFVTLWPTPLLLCMKSLKTSPNDGLAVLPGAA